MSYGICTLSIVPCRKEASDPSEMVTQLLFGETFEILEKQEKWSRIRNVHDAYESWVDNKQITHLSDEDHSRIASSTCFKNADLMGSLMVDGQSLLLPAGSSLPGLTNGQLRIVNSNYVFEGQVIDTCLSRKMTIPDLAMKFLNTPYLWGGRSPAGMDCSGFTQVVFSLAGMQLPRDAWQQAELGESITLEAAQPCDLAFFQNAEGRITHVGIVLEDRKIIHASGKVRIDTLGEGGIENELGSITHNLSHISRL